MDKLKSRHRSEAQSAARSAGDRSRGFKKDVDRECAGKEQLGDKSLNISHYGPYPEDFTKRCGFDAEGPKAAKQYILKGLNEWAPQLRNLIESTSDGFIWRDLYEPACRLDMAAQEGRHTFGICSSCHNTFRWYWGQHRVSWCSRTR